MREEEEKGEARKKENKGKEKKEEKEKTKEWWNQSMNCGLTAYDGLEVGLDICPRMDLIRQVSWLASMEGCWAANKNRFKRVAVLRKF